MNLKLFAILFLSAISMMALCQTGTDINKTDQQGRKQGHWIKKYPNGNIQYEGIFRDDQPVGELKRYFENRTLKSILIYSNDGKTADATIFHPNGFISSQGRYFNEMKEGKWKFYSISSNGYLINEEEYTNNIRNGISLKYFPDSTIAEKLNYNNGKKEGEWLQYYENGRLYLKAFYSGGILEGKFEAWYEDGKPQLSGIYKNNLREGTWLIYKEDGSLKYELNYVAGITNNHQMDIDAAIFFDSLEKNKDRIADPEKTGVIR